MTNETKAPSVDEIRGSFSLREASEGGIVYALNKHPTGFLSAAKMLHSHVGALLDENDRLRAKLDSIRYVINGPKHSADKVAVVSGLLAESLKANRACGLESPVDSDDSGDPSGYCL